MVTAFTAFELLTENQPWRKIIIATRRLGLINFSEWEAKSGKGPHCFLVEAVIIYFKFIVGLFVGMYVFESKNIFLKQKLLYFRVNSKIYLV